MTLAMTNTRSIIGIQACPVTVEVHLSNGLPGFSIVGMPETAVKESRDRVRSAIINSHFTFPTRKIIVNLAPADLPKTGSSFDLPIALGILAASRQIPSTLLAQHEFMGELALDGQLRGVPAVLPAVLAAQRAERTIILPDANATEVAVAHTANALLSSNLNMVCAYLCQKNELRSPPYENINLRSDSALDWSEVKGQTQAKYAMEIAAYGGHSILLSGPPGSGKTMLARRFSTLLPELNDEQALECAAIRSIRGDNVDVAFFREPPVRSPHHTASPIALVGGGSPPKPGEISLAHHGVLFLDELPEFNRHVLETLREPLESGHICISRASAHIKLPAQFQLIAAMNPCPCGHWGNSRIACRCTPDRIQRYIGKLSAPLLDRIDMQINVHALTEEELLQSSTTPSGESLRIRAKVTEARMRQWQRQNCLNAQLSSQKCEDVCALNETERRFLRETLRHYNLSARGYHRLLKVARTIADKREAECVDVSDLQQALAFKQVLGMPEY